MLLYMIHVDEDSIAALKEENKNEEKSLFDEASSSLRMKIIICSTLLRMLRTLREEHDLIIKLKGFCPDNKIPKGLLIQGSEGLKSAYEKFMKTKILDSVNEKRPESVI